MTIEVTVPKTMRRLILETPNDKKDFSKVVLRVEEVPIPTPKRGELLVKVLAAPVNPSDYGVRKPRTQGPSPRSSYAVPGALNCCSCSVGLGQYCRRKVSHANRK